MIPDQYSVLNSSTDYLNPFPFKDKFTKDNAYA